MTEETLDLTSRKQELTPERDERGRLLPGNTANPNGRPKDSISIKSAIKKRLKENPDLLEEITTYFLRENRELLWQMLEGRPSQKMEGDAENPFIVQIVNYESSDNAEGILPMIGK